MSAIRKVIPLEQTISDAYKKILMETIEELVYLSLFNEASRETRSVIMSEINREAQERKIFDRANFMYEKIKEISDSLSLKKLLSARRERFYKVFLTLIA